MNNNKQKQNMLIACAVALCFIIVGILITTNSNDVEPEGKFGSRLEDSVPGSGGGNSSVEPTEPDKPTEPTEPDKPTEPTKPDKPTEPTKPSGNCPVCGSSSHSQHPKEKPPGPEQFPSPPPDEGTCTICNSDAHKTENHPRCPNCGSTDHTADNCTSPPPAPEGFVIINNKEKKSEAYEKNYINIFNVNNDCCSFCICN